MAVLIKHGRVIDPTNDLYQQPMDVLLENGKVTAAAHDIVPPIDCEVFDASGYIVCPGLIDLHVHCFPGGTSLGVDPDKYCLSRGVTTVVDAGSAGASNFSQFLSYSQTKKTRVLSLLHASRVGLESAGCANAALPGELESLADVNEEQCLECIKNHSDVIVGVKIRLSAQIANDGKHEAEAYRRALSISATAKLPLMVHHSFSTVPHSSEPNVLGVPGSLRKGDIHTHMYHGFQSTIIDTTSNTVHQSILSARERGVYFDVGHGMGAFNWTVAELATKTAELWPHTISTDLHTESLNGPAYDLPTVMTKILQLGMPLFDVIKATTSTPAKIINREDMIGSLSPGVSGDVTVLELRDCNVMLEDCQMQLQKVTRRLVPIAAWRAGERVNIYEPWNEWPNVNKDYHQQQKKERVLLQVK